jgi:type IV pilus assembly protein PilX
MTRHLQPQRQKGAVLITALIFLVILTLISVAAMRSSTLELRMAGNEQEHRRALQSTQSAINGVLANANIQVVDIGITTCYQFDSTDTTLAGCTSSNTETLTTGPGYGGPNLVSAHLDEIGACPRTIANSARGQGSLRASNGGGSASTGNCAYFTMTSRYDDTPARGGAAETAEGVIKLIF